MNEMIRMMLIVCPLVFVAGFVDAVAGGGGLISLPAYMLAGLPTHIAAGSNITSLVLYTMGGKVLFMLAVPAAVCSMLGANLGARFAIKGGAKNVRHIIFIVIGLLFIKTAWNFMA